MNINNLIGEATAYDKKLQLEVKRPKSWLKSVSAFANGEGGTLVFGISDDDQVVGLADAETDAERISEEIKTKLDPIPTVNLEFKEVDGKKLVLLHVYKGQETPYYYIGDKQRLAFVRVGNESVVADRLQLKNLVMRGAGRSFDAIPSPYKFEDMAFSKLKSVHFKRLNQSFDDSDFVSWGIVNPAKRNVLDLKNETCKNREKRNVLKISHTRHFKTTKSSPKRAAFIVLNGKQTAFK